MPTKTLYLLILIIGICLSIYGIQTWYFKLIDTRMLPEFVPSYNSIISDITYGISLMVLAYLAHKKSSKVIDLSIALLAFPVFHQIQYFIETGPILWIVGIIILLSSLKLPYKLGLIIIFSIAFDSIGRGSYFAYLMYASIILISINLLIQLIPINRLLEYKMNSKNRIILALMIVPFIVSEVINKF